MHTGNEAGNEGAVRTDEGWLTSGEAATYSRYSVTTVNRAARRGELEAVKRAGQWRHRLEWLDTWLNGGSRLLLLLAVVAAVLASCSVLRHLRHQHVQVQRIRPLAATRHRAG